MQRMLSLGLLSAALGWALLAHGPARAQGQTLVYTAGVPIAPATMNRPLVNVMRIAGVKLSATVNDLDAIRPARPGRPAETNVQASQRKADAIVQSVNTAIQAQIALGLLPANTPIATRGTEPATIQAKDRLGRPFFLDRFGRPTLFNTGTPMMVANSLAGFGIVNIPGVTEILGPMDGSRDPTGEPAGGGMLIRGGGTGGTGGTMPSSSGGMGGTGSRSGMSTGTDATGAASVIAFGVYTALGQDASCGTVMPPSGSCPGAFIASLVPGAGRDDDSALGDLADLFSQRFRSDGYTATYDPVADTLWLDAPLTPFETLLVMNTDPGLELTMVLRLIPEPAALPVLLLGLAALGLARPRAGRAVGTR
jgi:hypothetical protein